MLTEMPRRLTEPINSLFTTPVLPPFSRQVFSTTWLETLQLIVADELSS